jgi:DNA helicase-2/ATP-dependent DNA helicase PcrA
MRHDELAELVLDESGYTGMLKDDKSPLAQGRLDNLKELVRSMGGFDSLEAYLEHVALVMDLERADTGDEVWLMTLHAAKGLEFPLVFLPGWEETVFPSQRALEEKGSAALEEERRLAYVGLTRARERAVISFAANRQIFGRWQSVLPSRFIDELPADQVDAGSDTGYFGAETSGYGAFAEPMNPLASSYSSPGWRRLQNAQGTDRGRRPPPTIEGEARLIATESDASGFALGARVFHQKFGYGEVRAVEGNKLTVAFDKAGEKRVIDSFLVAADVA